MPVHVLPVDLGPTARGWFTGRAVGDEEPAVGRAGNLSPLRPHVPDRLAADVDDACGRMGVRPGELVTMRQVHGSDVGVVERDLPRGAQVRGVDALVTDEVARPLVVFTADCVPVLLASEDGVAVVHAGRRGLVAGVVSAAVETLRVRTRGAVRAVLGPAIRGCCYEVPADVRDAGAASHPEAAATTTWGTPSLDLAAGVRAELRALEVAVEDVAHCTRCDPDTWFSHRADPAGGRQAGVVVRGRAA